MKAEAKTFLEVMFSEENEIQHDRVVMFTKKQWISWHKRKEEMPKARCIQLPKIVFSVHSIHMNNDLLFFDFITM